MDKKQNAIVLIFNDKAIVRGDGYDKKDQDATKREVSVPNSSKRNCDLGGLA
jgi:hypothetical protein